MIARAARRSQIAIGERRVGRDHHHARPVAAIARRLRVALERVLAELLPHRRAEHLKNAAEVRLHEHADGPSAERRRQHARRRADSALPSERDRARPGADAPSATGPVDADVSAARTCSGVIGRDRMSFRVPSFVSATTGLIERTFAIPGCSSSQPTIASAAFHTHSVHVRRIGVSSSPSSRSCVTPVILPKPLPDVERRRHAIGEQIAAVRENGRDAGAHGVALDDRRLPDAHAGDVGDGVELSRRKDAGLDAEVARAGALGGGGARDDSHREKRRSTHEVHRSW